MLLLLALTMIAVCIPLLLESRITPQLSVLNSLSTGAKSLLGSLVQFLFFMALFFGAIKLLVWLITLILRPIAHLFGHH